MSMKDFSIKEFIDRTGEWLKGTGPDHDIVISSRVRLARNLSDYNFTQRLLPKDAHAMIQKITKAIEASNFLKNNRMVHFEALDGITKQLLLERHLISRELAESPHVRALSFSADEIISIMINEEDHLRIQLLQSGFNLLETWRLADSVDRQLEKTLTYAFDQKYGFLTACPTNLGTGMRASCMLHLPALVMTKQINKVLQAVAKLNLAVRGLYGEGTQASGNFFQFSNQITLGKEEEKIVDDLERVVKQIIEHEREARIALNHKRKTKLLDQIWRALGALKAARVISSQETMALMSMLRLGLDIGIIANIDRHKVNELFIVTQPAHLQLKNGHVISPQERDIMRAQIIREYLSAVSL
jgi:protein arginine kinase